MCRSIKTLHNYKPTGHRRRVEHRRLYGAWVSERAPAVAERATRLANSQSSGRRVGGIDDLLDPERLRRPEGERSFCRRASISASWPWGQPPRPSPAR